MSKVTDCWVEFNAAQAKEVELVAACAEVGAAHAELDQALHNHRCAIREVETELRDAKSLMIGAAGVLGAQLELASAGKEHHCGEAWAGYATARETVARLQNRLTTEGLECEDAQRALLQARSRVDEAEASMVKIRKYICEAAAKLRSLVPSEVAGYCGKLAPNGSGEQSLLVGAEP